MPVYETNVKIRQSFVERALKLRLKGLWNHLTIQHLKDIGMKFSEKLYNNAVIEIWGMDVMDIVYLYASDKIVISMT